MSSSTIYTADGTQLHQLPTTDSTLLHWLSTKDSTLLHQLTTTGSTLLQPYTAYYSILLHLLAIYYWKHNNATIQSTVDAFAIFACIPNMKHLSKLVISSQHLFEIQNEHCAPLIQIPPMYWQSYYTTCFIFLYHTSNSKSHNSEIHTNTWAVSFLCE